MKRISYRIFSCLVLPLIAFAAISQAHAQSDAHKKGQVGALMDGSNVVVAAVFGPTTFITTKSVRDSKGNLTTAYYGYSNAGVRVTPSAGRRATGLARAIMDVCHADSSWNECETDCSESCSNITNPSCGDDAPNNGDCISACTAVQASNTLCNGGNDGL